MRATAVVALLLHALPGAYGVAATTFVRVPEDLAYAEAEARCTQIGAAIASIHSAAENELARTACDSLTSCWLGLVEMGVTRAQPRRARPGAGRTRGGPGPFPRTRTGRRRAGQFPGAPRRRAGGRGHGTTGHGLWSRGATAYPLCRVAGDSPPRPQPGAVPGRVGRRKMQKLDSDECAARPGRRVRGPSRRYGRCPDVPVGRDRRACKDENGNDSLEFKAGARRRPLDGVEVDLLSPVGPAKPRRSRQRRRAEPERQARIIAIPAAEAAVIIIFFVILPLCCIGCPSPPAACQQNNRRPQARVQQQPVATPRPNPPAAPSRCSSTASSARPGPTGALRRAATVVQPTVEPTVVQPARGTHPSSNPPVVQPTVVGAVVQGAVVRGAVVQGEIQREY